MTSWEEIESTGQPPSASFGHTLCQISKTKVLLFGGATGEGGKYTMTDATYVFNLFKQTWINMNGIICYILGSGTKPIPRAAHASTAVGNYKMVVYGGATGSNCILKFRFQIGRR